MSDDFANMDEVNINFRTVADSDSVPLVIRHLAERILHSGYFKVGEWFKCLDDEELDYVRYVCNIEPEDEEYFEVSSELVLLTMMLSKAEGVSAGTLEDLSGQTGMTKLFCSCTVLGRKGLVKVNYNNMSYGNECNELPLMEP